MDVSCWPTAVPFFPWPHIQGEIDAIDAQVYRAAIALAHELHGGRARSCPGCGRRPENLFWVCVTSPDVTWRAGTGRVGFLTVCEPCLAQIDFLVDQELTDLHAEDWRAGEPSG